VVSVTLVVGQFAVRKKGAVGYRCLGHQILVSTLNDVILATRISVGMYYTNSVLTVRSHASFPQSNI
jgi:hypothetical protein